MSAKRLALLTVLALAGLPSGAALAAPDEGDPPPPPPQLSISPGGYDFGLVEVDRGGQQAGFNIQNIGSDWAPVDAQIVGDDASAFWFDWNGCGGQLSPWQTCGLGVRFNPTEGRDYHATLRIRSGDTDFTAELTGTGGVRHVSATPDPVDFGTVAVGEQSTRSVTLSNDGNVFFQSMVAIPVGGDVGAFRVLEDGCSMHILSPGVSCKLKLRFAPDEADNAEATLAVIGGNDQPVLIALRGVGTQPAANSSAPTAAAGTDRPAAKSKPAKRAARVAFNWRRGLAVPFRDRRIDLGVARCNGAPRCRVAVRAWVVTAGADGELRTIALRRATWRLGGGGSPVALRLPKTLAGTPVRAIAQLRTSAAGRSTGLQRLNAKLVEGIRVDGAVVADRRR